MSTEVVGPFFFFFFFFNNKTFYSHGKIVKALGLRWVLLFHIFVLYKILLILGEKSF